MAFGRSSHRAAHDRRDARLHVNGLPIGFFAIMLAFLASMGGFIFGYDTGQISDILIMDDFKLRFAHCSTPGVLDTCNFSNVRSGLIVALLSIGTLIGALIGAPLADLVGRRHAMSLECIIFVVGVIIQLCTFSKWYQFAIGRLIAGLGVGGLSAAVPMYQAETAPPQIRGTNTATYQLFITFGILVAYCISIGTRNLSGAASWRTVVGIGIIWAVFLGVSMLFMPESPRWSARHGNLTAARHAIALVRGIPDDHPIVDAELQEIIDSLAFEEGVSKEKMVGSDERLADADVDHKGHASRHSPTRTHAPRGPPTWLECFVGYKKGTSRIGYRTLLGMALQTLQQLTGANYFFYYGATIFQSVGIQDSFVTQIILGAVNFGCTFGGLYIMEKYGRRIPLIWGGIWQSAWLFVFAAAGTAKDPTENKNIGKLMIVSACLFIFGYAMTWARNGIWILIGETFPTRTRAKQGALATSANWFWNFLLAFFTPFIVSSIKFRYGFVFAACNLLGAVVVWLFLYESSGMSLENVDLMYNDPACQPWTSRQWAPPGYASRKDLVEEKRAQEAARVANLDSEKDKGGAMGLGAGEETRHERRELGGPAAV